MEPAGRGWEGSPRGPDLQAFPALVLEPVWETLEKATRGLQAGPAQPDVHPHVLACPWSCLVLRSLIAEQLRKPRVREVASSTQSYGWWQSRAKWAPRLSTSPDPVFPGVALGCSRAWAPASLRACDLLVPISVTAVSAALSPLGGALAGGLSVLCVSLSPLPPDHQNVLSGPPEFLALKDLHRAFLSLPSSSCPLGLVLAPPHRGGPLAVAVAGPSAAATQTGQPFLSRWEV